MEDDWTEMDPCDKKICSIPGKDVTLIDEVSSKGLGVSQTDTHIFLEFKKCFYKIAKCNPYEITEVHTQEV